MIPAVLRRSIDGATARFALAVIALNLIDGFATLVHVSQGARELNPIMHLLLDAGPVPFVLGKHALGSAGVLGLVIHAEHRAARFLLRWVLFPAYVAIVVYQLALFVLV